MFRDITTLLDNPQAFKYAISRFVDFCEEKRAGKIVAIESRGFIFGGAVADRLGLGLILVRKQGKLPGDKISQEYQLEYGSDILEMHRDALTSTDRVVIIDDLLATGGTARATVDLVEQTGATVAGIAFVVGLSFLPGGHKLEGYDILTLVDYDSE